MKLHVLTGDGTNYQIVVHGSTPNGNNAAGFSWSSLLVATGRNKTVLTVGSGPAQTTQAEADAIAAGTTMEATFSFTDDPNLNNAQRNALLDSQATQLLSNLQSRYADELKYYGATRS